MFASVAIPRRLLPVAALLVVAAVATPARASAQAAAEHLALGERDDAAMNVAGALKHYQAAIDADPKSYEALWKATHAAVDLGEYESNPAERERLYTTAEQYARRAVEANPGDAEGHFELARALGRRALSLGTRERIRYAGDVRTHALEALRLNPKHPGAEHVMGMWNYNVMRLNGMSRFIAKNFLGGKVFDSANWDDAQRYMEESVAAEPGRLVHHLDLARVYAARGDAQKAREQYEATIRGTPREYNDRHYQTEAAAELAKLR
jgi:tetratricopeptide (TPR) repeat protein